MKTEYKSDHEKGLTMQTIAAQRLDAAWMKTMCTEVGMLELANPKANEAAEKLGAAMKLITEAKWLLLYLPVEECAGLHNEKGGYESAEQIVKRLRNPTRQPEKRK